VVATVNGGSEEIITDEEIGTLVKAGDAEGLAKAIMTREQKKGSNCKEIERTARKYSWEEISREFIKVYNKTEHPYLKEGE